MQLKPFEYVPRTMTIMENAASKTNPLIVFLAGLLFCVVAVILPELLPAIKSQEGFVWAPINSQNYRLGDLYYYGAWLKEVLETGIPAYSPSAGELTGQPLIETWRFLGLTLAALPGLVISDIRVLIVFDYGFSAALFFCIAFLFAYTLTRNSWIGLVAGIAVLFMTDRLWVPMVPYVERIIDSWRIAASAFKRIIDYIIYTRNFIEYDIYGSTFRFINISMSGPILLLYYYIITLVYKYRDIKSYSALFIMSPLMAFTYPSHTIIAYGLLVTFSLVSLFRRSWKKSLAFVSVGTVTIIFLEIIKYRKMISELFNKSELWNNIFASEKFVLLHNEIGFILATILLNKYLLTFLIMVYLTRKRPLLRDIVVATGMIAIPLSSIYIFNMPQLWGRILGRGIDHIWFMLFIVVVGNAIYQTISITVTTETAKKVMPGIYQRVLGLSVFAIVLIMVTLIAFGSFNLARHTASNGSRIIPEATMDAYRWINSNLPQNAEVATLDWLDITLLPVFTNVNLTVGHSIIDGRNPTDEMKRFMVTWKFLGNNRLQFEELIESGPASMSKLFQAMSYINPPCLPDKQFEASQFMLGILYWPHVKEIGGIKIAEEGKEWTITPEFRSFVMSLYDSTTVADFIGKYKVQYITMTKEQVELLGVLKGMRLLYKTKTRSIFALTT